jgi:hypothetical protein
MTAPERGSTASSLGRCLWLGETAAVQGHLKVSVGRGVKRCAPSPREAEEKQKPKKDAKTFSVAEIIIDPFLAVLTPSPKS